MHSIKIIGAGSIGNHIAHAARTRGWKVLLTDVDAQALERAKQDIYPGRYGAWDAEIETALSKDVMKEACDVVFIGTPPDVHVQVALECLHQTPFKALMVEKPICGPDLSGCADMMQLIGERGIWAGVGYNHCLGENTVAACRLLDDGVVGEVSTISARTREHWSGIFGAHPWLAGPHDSYLGFSTRGGGAAGEHSHALNIWQHFAHSAGAGRVVEVSATMDVVRTADVDYDRLAFLTLRTESGLVGDVIMDVVTEPAEKSARIQGDRGFLSWRVNAPSGADSVVFANDGGASETIEIPKTRADDFIAEIDHLSDVLCGQGANSPIAIERGLDTMMVISAAHRSHELGRRVHIDWSRGYVPEAIE